MAGLSLSKRKIERQKKFATFSPLSSRFFGYIFPPPKTALFGERTLKEATASSAGEGEFSRQSLARLILSRREKRENTSSSKLFANARVLPQT